MKLQRKEEKKKRKDERQKEKETHEKTTTNYIILHLNEERGPRTLRKTNYLNKNAAHALHTHKRDQRHAPTSADDCQYLTPRTTRGHASQLAACSGADFGGQAPRHRSKLARWHAAHSRRALCTNGESLRTSPTAKTPPTSRQTFGSNWRSLWRCSRVSQTKVREN